MIRSTLIALTLICGPATSGFCRDAPPRVEAEGRAPQAWRDFLDQLRAEVVFLGERHDNEHHHRLQAEAVAALDRRFADQGGVSALVFEMIPEAKEKAANAARGWPEAATAAQSDALGEAVGWAQSGWPDFALYAPILRAAPRAYIAAAGYPRRALMRAATTRDWLSNEPMAARLGLTLPLPPDQQMAREQAQIASHCNAIPASAAPMMVAAQRARDASLARAVLRAREAAARKGLSGPVAVITGGGHARRDFGAPALLRRAEPSLRVVSLGLIEPDGAEARELATRFDVWARTPGPKSPRGDPCEAFRKRAEKKSGAEK